MVVGLPALERVVEKTGAPGDQGVPYDERIELVAVHSQIGLAFVSPLILLADKEAEKIMGELGQQVIMVACYPYHLNVAVGCTERSEIGKQLPVTAWYTTEIEIIENIAQ